MNTEKVIRLYHAITDIREDYLEDALPVDRRQRRRSYLRAGAATAACICLLLAGILGFARWAGRGQNSGTGSSGGYVAGAAYQSYAGPVLPLTSAEAQEGLSLTRALELDMEDFYAKDSCRAVDTYVLRNNGSSAVTATLLYPFADTLRSAPERIPTLTADTGAVTPELVIGPSIPEGQADWTEYLALMQGETFALPDPTELLERPVTVYELRDFWAEETARAANPTLSLEYTVEWEKSAVFSWGFNGGRNDPSTGYCLRSRSVPRPGEAGERQSAYLIVLGEDIRPELRAYTDGGCSTPMEGAGAAVLRYGSTLGDMLAAFCEEMRSWEPEATLGDRFTYRELAAAAVSFALERGWWDPEDFSTLRFWALEDVLNLCCSLRRILLLRFTVTVPPGESVTVTAVSVKEGSYNYVTTGFGKTPRGFDALSARAGKLTPDSETVTLTHLNEQDCLSRDLTPEEDKLRYYVDVQRHG